jgi:hypothetical protein
VSFFKFKNGGENLKAVFFISQPLKGIVLETLKDILLASKFQFLTIVTNVNPVSYDQSMEYFDEIRDDCLMWLSNPVSLPFSDTKIAYFNQAFFFKRITHVTFFMNNFRLRFFLKTWPNRPTQQFYF